MSLYSKVGSLLLACSVLTILSYSLISFPELASAYTPHAPILIDSNTNFNAVNGVTGGSGKPSDPYIIEGWEINASTTNGIEIRNTDDHFVIRGVYAHSGFADHSGIYLYNVTNGHVWNSTLSYNSNGVFLIYCSNNTVSNNSASDNMYGIGFGYSVNMTVTDNNVSRNGNGIRLGVAHNSTIRRNYVISNDAEGIGLYFSNNSTIAENVFVEDGIFLAGDSLSHYNTHTIPTNNLVNGKPIYYYKNRSNVDVDGIPIGQLIVANCTSVSATNLQTTNTTVGLLMAFVDEAMISGNVITNNWHGVFFRYSNNITFANNSLSLNNWTCMYVHTTTNASLVNNAFFGNKRDTIRLKESPNALVRDNNIASNSGYGLFLDFSDYANVTGNNFSSNRWWGVQLDSSDDVHLTHNNFSSNDGYGILLHASEKTSVTDNTFISNTGKGIYVRSSSNSTVVRNTFSENEYGVFLESSTGINVYHNNLIDNTNQAYDDGSNGWDDGYPSGGNYWSDYAGLDDCSGPNQDVCPDPDDIGDTPHVIDADSQDRYPLMSSSGIVPARPPIVQQANLNGKNLENVTLTWSLSLDDGMGRKTVSGYRIYRNSTFNSDGLDYQLVAFLPNGTIEFTDNYAGEGDLNNYFYRVCAVDLNNNSTCAINQAAKYTRPLLTGLNLISIPLIQTNESITTVLQTVKFSKAWTYDSLGRNWKWYVTFKPYEGELRKINHRMGVWVNITANSNLTVAGIVPTTTIIQLRAGWNLVGFPSFNTGSTVGDLRNETGTKRVEGLDSSAVPYLLMKLDNSDILHAGYGYWAFVESNAIWIVMNS